MPVADTDLAAAAAVLARERLHELMQAAAGGSFAEHFRVEVLDRPRTRKRRRVETIFLAEHLPSGCAATGLDRVGAFAALEDLLWESRGSVP